MKKFDFKRAILGMLFLVALSVFFNSCTKAEIEPTTQENNQQELVIEYEAPLLPEFTPYHLQENDTDQPVPMHPAYVKFGEEMVEGSIQNRSCHFEVFIANNNWHQLYAIWQADKSYQNCINMQVAFCNYLITRGNCYGFGPINSCDNLYEFCYPGGGGTDDGGVTESLD